MVTGTSQSETARSSSIAGEEWQDPGDAQAGPAQEFRAAATDARKIAEFASYFASAKIDQIKVSVRKLVILAIIGVVALLAGLGIILTAGALIVIGVAEALGASFHSAWAGDLVTGLIVLGAIALTAQIVMRKITHTFRTQMVSKYEQRLQQQRIHFGTDVHEQARRVD